MLEAALKGLEAVKPTISPAQASTSVPIQNDGVNRWMKIINNYFGPILLTGWGLIVQSGILSSDVAKRIPLVGGIIGLGLTIKNNIDTCIEQAKTEDQAGLIQICDSLVEIFMSTDRIGQAVKERLAAREQHEKSLRYIEKAHQDLDAYKQDFNSTQQSFKSDIQKLGSMTEQLGQLSQLSQRQLSQLGQLRIDRLDRIDQLEKDVVEIKQGIALILK